MSDESKDRIIDQHNEIHLMKQARKALNDIAAAFNENNPTKAEYQVHLLRTMIDEQPSRRKPWRYYQRRVDEEFEDQKIQLHRTELLPGGFGAMVGFSDDYPDRQFLLIPKKDDDL